MMLCLRKCCDRRRALAFQAFLLAGAGNKGEKTVKLELDRSHASLIEATTNVKKVNLH